MPRPATSSSNLTLTIFAAAGRPFEYVTSASLRRGRKARELAERDGIKEGLVCILSKLEPCRTFSFKYQRNNAYVNAATRRCPHLYYYFMEREFGLTHVQVQTWFSLRMQVFVNGHDWLARKLDATKIDHTQCDNVFVGIEDVERAQRVSDRLSGLCWPAILDGWARRVKPLMGSLLGRMQYYWATSRCEHSTDVIFESASDLKELYPKLISHSTFDVRRQGACPPMPCPGGVAEIALHHDPVLGQVREYRIRHVRVPDAGFATQ